MPTPVFELTFDHRRLRTNGDVLSGSVKINLRRVYQSEVEAVNISLRGEVHTQVTEYGTGAAGATSARQSTRFLEQTEHIWKPDVELPLGASQFASFPFEFKLSDDGLPPSFSGGDGSAGGLVQYYLHVVGVRKLKKEFTINRVFPFLPVDRGPGPFLRLPDWPGDWKTYTRDKDIRRLGIIPRHGHVQVNFSVPKLPKIPLRRQIPIKLHIICTSKMMSWCDASKFEFPRNPKLEECDLNLLQEYTVKAQGHVRTNSEDLGLQAGFGKLNDKEKRASWGRRVDVEIRDPYWVPEDEGNKGVWREEITFSTTITFRCSLPFEMWTLSTALYLGLKVGFPGLGNDVTIKIGKLSLSSCIEPHDTDHDLGDWEALTNGVTMPEPQYSPPEVDLPPAYWEVVQPEQRGKD